MYHNSELTCIDLGCVGAYFASAGLATAGTPFLDQVPIRFGIDNPEDHYHVRVGVGALLRQFLNLCFHDSHVLPSGTPPGQPLLVQYIPWIVIPLSHEFLKTNK